MREEMLGLSQQLKDLRIEYWLNNTLFTFEWWVLLITTVSIFIVGLIILDKKRIVEIFTYGLLVAITGAMLDVFGVSLVLWQYPHTLLPFPIFTAVHIIQMPIIYMIIYQYFDEWKTFLIANIINALLFAFILEPLLALLQAYEAFYWKHVYSVIPYISIAIVYKAVIHKLKKVDINYYNTKK